MALAPEVIGPYTISTIVGSTTRVLGRGDNDDLFKLDLNYSYTDIFTNDSGTMPYDSIRTGVKAECFFSLIVMDRAVLAAFLMDIDGGATTGLESPFPVVGGLLNNSASSGKTTFSVAVNYGSTSELTLFRCRLLSLKQSDFGNKATRFTFHCEALPLVTTGNIAYTSDIYSLT